MNVEQNRLDTFQEWPHDAVVSPPRIAKAGFFYTKQGLTVECFSCHLLISEWNYGDQVMARHKNLSPNCPFVLNPTTSGNVPIISQPTNVPSTSATSDSMKDEAKRLETFKKWPIPHIVSPESLARAGFYYLNSGDNTRCAFCKGVVRAWEVGDNPDIEHKRHFEDCPFVLTEIIPRINLNSSNSGDTSRTDSSFSNLRLVSNENLQRLGVQTHKGPKKPNYATLESRLRSFAMWPPDLIQTPDILAQAGFYYEGMGDQVRCFHCDGGLRHWDPQDDPWTEHARWFPRCSFIKLVKGQDFVTACSLELNVNSNLEEVDQKNSSNNPSRKREVSEREVQEHMTGEVALSALSIGLNVENVKRAIREKLEQTGRGYSQPDALVEAALNIQHSEDEISDQDSPTTFFNVKNVVESVVDTVISSSANNGDINKNENLDSSCSRTNVSKEITKSSTKALSLEEENRLLKEARMCKICMDAEVGIVFLPCGHLTTCVNCAPNLEDCPVCRSAIKATVRTFLS